MRNLRRVIMFVCGIATAFSSCVAGEQGAGVPADAELKTLTVRIAEVASMSTRAQEDQVSASDAASIVRLESGHIFVVKPDGGVIYNTPLVVSLAVSSAGQTLSQTIPANSRVFILGNIPSGATATSGLGTLSAITSAAAAIATQTDYKTAALANSDFQPAAISPVQGSATDATVSVTVKPVIARLELAKLTGNADIKSFTVTGVFLDSYYPSFTFGGSYSGTVYSQGQNTTFHAVTATTGDIGSWPAAPGDGKYVVALPAPKVWAYNVAANANPRLIIRLTNIKHQQAGAAEIDLRDAVRYLTIKSYTGLGSTAFVAGKIYRISNIPFSYGHLSSVPNGSDVDLGVNIIDVIEWDVDNPGVIVGPGR